MYRLTESPGVVQCLETMVFFGEDSDTWQAAQYRAWVADGGVPDPVPPPFAIHSPSHYRYIRDQAFAWMRAEAVERGYDGIESCASYYNSGVARYRAEARAMVAWRDAVNQALEQLVLAPPDGIETWEQVRALLPQPETFAWPEKAELPLETGSTTVVF